jgi:proteasome lid subunit RPN8/RPN11
MGEVLAMSFIVKVPEIVVAKTITSLRIAGARKHEQVVLWLGRRTSSHITVEEAFVPLQEAEADYFHIPSEGMTALLQHLGERRQMIAAQVHTHPHEAFHSAADDRWAIVRHEGALSLVVPRFCEDTDVGSFVRDAALFRLSPDNDFIEVPSSDVADAYEVVR